MERRSFIKGLATLFGSNAVALAAPDTQAAANHVAGHTPAASFDRFMVKLWCELTKGGVKDLDNVKLVHRVMGLRVLNAVNRLCGDGRGYAGDSYAPGFTDDEMIALHHSCFSGNNYNLDRWNAHVGPIVNPRGLFG